MMQNFVKIPSINSLQLGKLNNAFCLAEGSPPNTEALPHSRISCLHPKHNIMGIQTHSSELPLLGLFCFQVKLPKIRREICLIDPNSTVTTKPDQPALTP